MSTSTPRRAPGRAPAAVLLAAAVVALQGLVLLVLGVLEAFSVSSAAVTMGVTTALFFAVYGLALGWFARRLVQLLSWPRAPIVLTELIALGLAWGFRGGDTTLVAVALALSAVIVLVALLLPASLAALSDE